MDLSRATTLVDRYNSNETTHNRGAARVGRHGSINPGATRRMVLYSNDACCRDTLWPQGRNVGLTAQDRAAPQYNSRAADETELSAGLHQSELESAGFSKQS
jgi:hypothetical protein